MTSNSPLALRVTAELLRHTQDLELADVLSEEYNTLMHFYAHSEFYEGVRAVLIM
jgi:enoyl-CoA hydratase/carnithine racemase